MLLVNRTDNLKDQTEAVKKAHSESPSSIESIIRLTRDLISGFGFGLESLVKRVSEDTSKEGISEETKNSANQAVEKAKQAITEADQAIKDLLTFP